MRLHKAYDIVLTVIFVGIFGYRWFMGLVFAGIGPNYGYLFLLMVFSLFGLVMISRSVNKKIPAEFAKSRFRGIALQLLPMIYEYMLKAESTSNVNLLFEVFIYGPVIITYVMFSFARYKSVVAGDNDDEDAYIGRL